MKMLIIKALEFLKNFAPAKKIIKTIILSSSTRFALKIAIKKDKFLISFFGLCSLLAQAGMLYI